MSFQDHLVVTLARESENLIPSEFYDVRQEIKPKAGWIPMYALTYLAYIGCIIAFACIYSSESKKSYVDTQIFSFDNSGNDGFSCQMISKVTSSYEIDSHNDPTIAYQLVNVIESKSDFEEDTDSVKPCSHELTFFPGTSQAPYSGETVIYGGVSLFGSDMAFVMAYLHEPVIMIYNYTFGTYYDYIPKEGVLINSVAAGNTASYSPVYLRRNEGDRMYDIVIVEVTARQGQSPYIVDHVVTSFTYGFDNADFFPTILNDNEYNMYIMTNDTIFSVDIYTSSNLPLVPLLRLAGGNDSFRAAAVHSDPHGIKVYYVHTASYTDENSTATNTCYVWSQVYDSLSDLNCPFSTVGIVVDGENRVYYLERAFGSYYDVFGNGTIGQVAEFTSDGVPAGFAVNPAGDRILLTETGLPTLPDRLSFQYNPYEADGRGPYNVEPEVVAVMSQFGAGYFMCDDKLLTTDQYTPGNTDSYPQACRSNGVVGKVVFVDQYLFTTQDATNYAQQNSPSHCTDLYPVIADTISDLPPYSCTRNVHPSFLACFATAAANTQLIFQVVVFFSAIMLTRLAPRFPPKETVYRGAAPPPSIPPASVELAPMSGTANGGGSDCTYAGTGRFVNDEVSHTENPMARQR